MNGPSLDRRATCWKVAFGFRQWLAGPASFPPIGLLMRWLSAWTGRPPFLLPRKRNLRQVIRWTELTCYRQFGEQLLSRIARSFGASTIRTPCGKGTGNMFAAVIGAGFLIFPSIS